VTAIARTWPGGFRVHTAEAKILDEGNLPEGYGAGEDELASADNDETVVQVDFDADPA
jgi:hypothetical protein